MEQVTIEYRGGRRGGKALLEILEREGLSLVPIDPSLQPRSADPRWQAMQDAVVHLTVKGSGFVGTVALTLAVERALEKFATHFKEFGEAGIVEPTLRRPEPPPAARRDPDDPDGTLGASH